MSPSSHDDDDDGGFRIRFIASPIIRPYASEVHAVVLYSAVEAHAIVLNDLIVSAAPFEFVERIAFIAVCVQSRL